MLRWSKLMFSNVLANCSSNPSVVHTQATIERKRKITIINYQYFQSYVEIHVDDHCVILHKSWKTTFTSRKNEKQNRADQSKAKFKFIAHEQTLSYPFVFVLSIFLQWIILIVVTSISIQQWKLKRTNHRLIYPAQSEKSQGRNLYWLSAKNDEQAKIK